MSYVIRGVVRFELGAPASIRCYVWNTTIGEEVVKGLDVETAVVWEPLFETGT